MRPLTAFPERAQRLSRISSCLHPLHGDFPLLKATRLDSASLDKLRDMVNLYLLTSLEAFYKSHSFNMHDNLFDNCMKEILGLPNITPNGLILPKQQTFIAYNQIHSAIVDIINVLNLETHIKAVHAPVNVRLVNGTPNSTLLAVHILNTSSVLYATLVKIPFGEFGQEFFSEILFNVL